VQQFLPVARTLADEIEFYTNSVIEHFESNPRGKLPRLRDSDESSVVDLKKRKIVCDSELGGHLKSYRATA
jgi:hypothetical protein